MRDEHHARMAAVPTPEEEKTFLSKTLANAPIEDLVRGFLAVWLVLVLIALVFFAPTGTNDAAVASAKTLAIAVIAFYFGLHGNTPHRTRGKNAGKGVSDHEQSRS
jgi:hypothetical protein